MAEYVLVRNRKGKKSRRYYDDDEDDDDDDDDDSQIYRRINRRKPRNRYMSNDDIDSNYRREPSDSRIKIRKTTSGDRVLLDEDDNVIKVIRENRSPSPLSVDRRRLRHRPREAQTIFYETTDGHVKSRPSKKNFIETKKTQVIYADDEPTKIIKKVIIDPRTGDRETIYEKDRPKKQQKYFLKQRSSQILDDSDDSDEQQQQPQYVRIVKHRTIPTEILPRHEPPSSRYVIIKNKSNSEPIYGRTSKMPAIKTNRRVYYEMPATKPLTTYIYPHGKYYK